MADPKISGVQIPPSLAPIRPRGVPVQIPPTGTGSFRDALKAANSHAGADVINFKIGSGIKTIQTLSGLPYIREAILDAGSSEHLDDALMKGCDQYETQALDQSLADMFLSGDVAFAMAVRLVSNPLGLELQLRGSR